MAIALIAFGLLAASVCQAFGSQKSADSCSAGSFNSSCDGPKKMGWLYMSESNRCSMAIYKHCRGNTTFSVFSTKEECETGNATA
jgi:hypothetical protein